MTNDPDDDPPEPLTIADVARLGGIARAKAMTPEARREAASRAGSAPRPASRKNPSDPKWRKKARRGK